MKPWIKNLLALAIIASVGLAIFGMVRDGKAQAAQADPTATCPGVNAAMTQTMAGAPDPHSSPYNQALYQIDLRKVATLVIQNTQCFDPTIVNNATTALAGFGH
jgi:hypothetical protein